MTHKQARRTQRALERALFEPPKTLKAKPVREAPEIRIARLEKQIATTLNRRTRAQLERELLKERARIVCREVLGAEGVFYPDETERIRNALKDLGIVSETIGGAIEVEVCATASRSKVERALAEIGMVVGWPDETGRNGQVRKAGA